MKGKDEVRSISRGGEFRVKQPHSCFPKTEAPCSGQQTEPIDWSKMKAFKNPNFNDRLATSGAAKSVALARFRARAEDPAVAEQRTERALRAAERQRLAAERVEARRVEQEQQTAQAAADELAARTELEARQVREIDEQVELEAQRKRDRDARYAARKARKAA